MQARGPKALSSQAEQFQGVSFSSCALFAHVAPRVSEVRCRIPLPPLPSTHAFPHTPITVREARLATMSKGGSRNSPRGSGIRCLSGGVLPTAHGDTEAGPWSHIPPCEEMRSRAPWGRGAASVLAHWKEKLADAFRGCSPGVAGLGTAGPEGLRPGPAGAPLRLGVFLRFCGR